MAFKLFVGGLPFTTTDDELRELFAAYGDVESARVVTDRETGRSKGFGFVEMADEKGGKASLEALNNSDFGGRSIKVDEARPREDRPRRDFNGGGGGDRQSGGGSFRQRSW
ncbi:MAG TPA: RNA-binding protein [Candidatus Saccharimonadales bacterium]|jgi:RNA recognition motif-containing protein|nr:RNA-binding protein [Candidatus Saccharimonadales bacterium]